MNADAASPGPAKEDPKIAQVRKGKTNPDFRNSSKEQQAGDRFFMEHKKHRQPRFALLIVYKLNYLCDRKTGFMDFLFKAPSLRGLTACCKAGETSGGKGYPRLPFQTYSAKPDKQRKD
jgi:hypothetical protein